MKYIMIHVNKKYPRYARAVSLLQGRITQYAQDARAWGPRRQGPPRLGSRVSSNAATHEFSSIT
jgi:hypothetical protein